MADLGKIKKTKCPHCRKKLYGRFLPGIASNEVVCPLCSETFSKKGLVSLVRAEQASYLRKPNQPVAQAASILIKVMFIASAVGIVAGILVILTGPAFFPDEPDAEEDQILTGIHLIPVVLLWVAGGALGCMIVLFPLAAGLTFASFFTREPGCRQVVWLAVNLGLGIVLAVVLGEAHAVFPVENP